MEQKPIIEIKKRTKLKITVAYVFKANFNDTYWLEEFSIDLNGLKDKTELVWFDPYNGRNQASDVLVAVANASDEKFILLEKRKGEIKRFETELPVEHIVCINK